ncbi:hypothetical protein [Labrys neptuniae]
MAIISPNLVHALDYQQRKALGIPDLEHHCGSWIVVDRATGKAVLETFERRTAEAINQARYEVVTTAQWLCRLTACYGGPQTPAEVAPHLPDSHL